MASLLPPVLRAYVRHVLQPWVDALAAGAQLSCSSPFDATDAVLTVTFATEGEIDVRVFEAVELLALVGLVDANLWFEAVHAAAHRRSPWLRVPYGRSLPIKCILRIRHGEDFPTAITSWSERIVLGGVEGTASKEYTAIRTLLEAVCKTMELASERLGVSIAMSRGQLVIPVEITTSQGDYEERVAQLAQVASMQFLRDSVAAPAFRHHQWKSLFRVTRVDPGVPLRVSAKSFLLLTQIAECGIHFDMFWLHDIKVEEEAMTVFTRGLQMLLATETRGQQLSMRGTVKVIELPVFVTRRVVSAFFSALRISQAVRTLAINQPAIRWQEERAPSPTMTQDDKKYLWQWIAFALFSPYTRHRLERLRLHVQDLDSECVAVFHRVLEHPTRIMDEADDSTQINRFKEFEASSFMLTPPPSIELPRFGNDIELPAQVVLGSVTSPSAEGLDWIPVILAGCGPAWVHTREAQKLDSDPIRVSPCPAITIADMAEGSKAPVHALLQLIGSSLQDLHLVNSNLEGPLDDWLLSAVQACPHITRLDIAGEVHIASMDVFTQILSNTDCQIRSITLNDVIVQNSESITLFIRSLGDESLRLSKTLQTFSLHVRGVPSPLVDIGLILDSVLSKNHGLQQLNMLVTYQAGVVSNSFEAIESVCARHRGEPVAVRKGPLSLAHKISFISTITSPAGAVDENSGSGSRGVLKRLDNHVISLIFQFAAECKTREVSVWIHTDQPAEEEEDDPVANGADGEDGAPEVNAEDEEGAQ